MSGFFAGRSQEGQGRPYVTTNLAALGSPRRRPSGNHHNDREHPRNVLDYRLSDEEEDSDFEAYTFDDALAHLSLTREDDHNDDDEVSDNPHDQNHRHRRHRNSTSSIPSTRVAPLRILQNTPVPELSSNEIYLLPTSAYRIWIRQIDAPGYPPRGFRAVIPLSFTGDDIMHALRLPPLSSSTSSVAPSRAASSRGRGGGPPRTSGRGYRLIFHLEDGQPALVRYGLTLGRQITQLPARPLQMSIVRESSFR